MKTILVDCIHGLVIKGEGLFQEMHDLLETYDNPKIILTGANDEEMNMHGLHDLPYDLFTLKHDPEKTDPSYFVELLAKYSLTADQVIYFEHSPEAVSSAETLGIKSYYYDPEKKDLEALKDFIDTNI